MAQAEHMRLAHHRHCWLLFLLGGLAIEGIAGGAALPAQGPALSPKNFEVLGIRLPDSTFSDVERILGTAPSKQGPNAEISTSCYTSLGNNVTELEFEYWFESVVEFRLFIVEPQFASRCSKSKVVVTDLATGSGLRLGMNRDEVIKLLGPPSRKAPNSLTYEVSYDCPPTSEEVKRFKDAYRPLPVKIYVDGKIDLRFQHGKVVWVDVARGYDS